MEYHQLTAGFEFPSRTYNLDAAMVRDYLQAVDENGGLYRSEPLVPPLAVAAFAMSALSGEITMPPGTVHVSQELEFLCFVRIGDTITCNSKVSRKVDRGGLRLMTTDISVTNQNGEKVLGGRVGFVLPPPLENRA
jgi:hypothetical protein